jgi:hypothetical protein
MAGEEEGGRTRCIRFLFCATSASACQKNEISTGFRSPIPDCFGDKGGE